MAVRIPRRRKRKKRNRGSMPLTGHLKELRNRLIVCVVALFVCCVIFLMYAEPIVNLLTDMGRAYGYVYVFLAPQELLMQYLRVTLVGALCICLPLFLYQLWAFARPGLTRRENRTVGIGLLCSLVFFVIGILFAYEIILPFMLYFLINVGNGTGISASISVESYISFLLTVFIIFGLVFEMPVFTMILTRFHVLKPEYMVKGRKIAIVVIFILAAVITPPDIFSQIMVAVPMIVLYELSIGLCRILTHFTRKKEEQEE